ILLPPSCLARWRHAGGMAGPGSVSRLLPSHDAAGGLRLAQSRDGGWGSGGRTGGYGRLSHHAGWHPGLANVARGVSGCDLPSEGLGWSLLGADTSEAIRSHEARLVAGTPGGPVDPHHHWVHPVSWRVGPLGGGLPGFGSVCRAALSGFTTCNYGLRRPADDPKLTLGFLPASLPCSNDVEFGSAARCAVVTDDIA